LPHAEGTPGAIVPVSQPEALGQPAQHCHAVKRNDLNAVIERFYGEHVPENVEITITGESGADDVAAVRAGVVARNVEGARGRTH
jgi:hypothetical protein